jgi:hypothetical protein
VFRLEARRSRSTRHRRIGGRGETRGEERRYASSRCQVESGPFEAVQCRSGLTLAPPGGQWPQVELIDKAVHVGKGTKGVPRVPRVPSKLCTFEGITGVVALPRALPPRRGAVRHRRGDAGDGVCAPHRTRPSAERERRRARSLTLL